MKTFEYFDKTFLKAYGVIQMINLKAMAISQGNYQNRNDERICSLETFNNPDRYKIYKTCASRWNN